MMSIKSNLKFFFRIIIFIIGITQSSTLLATECVDFIKEVSPDGGITWYDANTENEAVTITNEATYKFTVIKCGSLAINNISVTDTLLNIQSQPLDGFLDDQWTGVGYDIAPLDGTERSFTVSSDICNGHEGTIQNIAIASALGPYTTATYTMTDVAWVRCDTTAIGGDGCTPGYWKQIHHYDSWPTSVSPDTLFSDIFNRVISIRTKGGNIDNPTLSQALTALGGQINTAARHATAAYLNALSQDVNYDMTTSKIINVFQESYDSNNFGDLIDGLVNFNEQNCPLN